MRMTELFEKAIAYAQTLESGEQDYIAETILTERPLAVIRARLAEAEGLDAHAESVRTRGR